MRQSPGKPTCCTHARAAPATGTTLGNAHKKRHAARLLPPLTSITRILLPCTRPRNEEAKENGQLQSTRLHISKGPAGERRTLRLTATHRLLTPHSLLVCGQAHASRQAGPAGNARHTPPTHDGRRGQVLLELGPHGADAAVGAGHLRLQQMAAAGGQRAAGQMAGIREEREACVLPVCQARA